MTILITGIGYLGAALAERLLAEGERVVALENYFSTKTQAIDQLVATGLTLVAGDCANPRDVARAFAYGPFSTVYHFAAQASAHPQAADPDYTERANLQGPRVILDAMRQHDTTTLVYASSFKVYGEVLHGTIDETAPFGSFRDLSHLSKVYVEKLLEMYARLYGLRCRSLRLGIVHGLSPVFKTDECFLTAPNKFCWQAARGEALSVYGGGRTPAGFIHVADAVAASIAAATQPDLLGYLPLNAVTEVLSVAEVATAVQAAGHARGLDVTIAGLDPAGLADEALRFRVRSALDQFTPAQPRAPLTTSLPAVLDHCLAQVRSAV